MTGADGGEAGRAGATEQREQQRLGLVVGGVPEHRIRPDEAVARTASASFEIRAVAEIGALDVERGSELVGAGFGGRSVTVSRCAADHGGRARR